MMIGDSSGMCPHVCPQPMYIYMLDGLESRMFEDDEWMTAVSCLVSGGRSADIIIDIMR